MAMAVPSAPRRMSRCVAMSAVVERFPKASVVTTWVAPTCAARLAAEPITALAVERILTLLVDLAFATNSHVAVDQDLVAGAVPLAVEQYGEYVRQVAAFVRERAT